MGVILVELVEKHDKDFIIDVVELDAVDRMQTGWVCTVVGPTILVVAVVLTPMIDEQIARVMVPTHNVMNRMWCVVSLAFGGGRISLTGCLSDGLDGVDV